ncbi:MAG: BrnA antitoxin family protein [Gammaproteobacteria bacterium]|nr:BrnA antitoxin family protein [Gammaproteobacteria bacterium]MBU1722372.1 BrnA antitoxin family protein [Gammaproteobacteria bacterium]MBU2004691.1 BrnA antitoxin family protein [Gammaproteobacteria bacterium]
MKKPYIRALSVEELAALPDDQIDTSDIPELDEEFWKNARVIAPQAKPTISLRLPQEVLDYFKAENPKGYTARMAAVLTAYVNAHQHS